jgi:hypothetical protein
MMPTWATKSNLAALNTARYSVPIDRTVGIADGIEMRVRDFFRVDGVIVLDGLLMVGG